MKQSWRAHLAIISSTVLSGFGTILKFYYTKGSFLIDPALKLYQNKAIRQLPYGSCKDCLITELEFTQNIYKENSGTPAVLMGVELGLSSTRVCGNLALMKFWRK